MRVLLIDDDPKECGLAACALRRALTSPEIVEIGDDTALERALQGPTKPALAITDFALNWSDGLAVFQRVKTAYPHCPVIVFTGVGDETLAVELLKAGVDDYVVKNGRRPLGEAALEALDAAAGRHRRFGPDLWQIHRMLERKLQHFWGRSGELRARNH